MNERILEIAKLATQQYSMTYYPKEFMENFAKLIVLECAEWMQSAEDTDGRRARAVLKETQGRIFDMQANLIGTTQLNRNTEPFHTHASTTLSMCTWTRFLVI